MKIQLTFFLILFCLCVSSHAQQTINSDQFLENRISFLDTLINKNSSDPKRFRPSWIEEIQVRTETDDMEFDRQEYLVRVRPSTPRIRKAQSRLYELYQQNNQLESIQLKEKFIVDAYFDWIDLYVSHQKLNLYQQQLNLFEDEEKVLLKLSQLPNSSVKELIQIKQKIQEKNLDLLNEADQTALILDPNSTPYFEDLIPIAVIRNKINLFPKNDTRLSQEVNLEKATIDAEIEMEMAEKRRIFDYGQIRYSGPHDDLLSERIAVGLGIQLPMGSNRKLKMIELELEKEMLDQEFKTKEKIYRDKIVQQIAQLQLLFDQLDYTQRLQNELSDEIEQLVKIAAQRENTTPLLFMSFKKDKIDQQLDLLKIKKTIYDDYINLLILTEVIYKAPFTNYLKGATK